MAQLHRQQKRFVEGITKGLTIKDSMKVAGYKTDKSTSYGSELLKKPAVMEALHKAGITDEYLANSLHSHISNGIGVKTTASDSIHAIELVYRLRGELSNNNTDTDTTNIYNVYIKELKNMNDNQLLDKLHSIEAELIQDKL